jgi:hypothetical protein
MENSIINQVLITNNAKGQKCIKICVQSFCIPQIGDRLAKGDPECEKNTESQFF